MKRLSLFGMSLVAASVLAACAVGPTYIAPSIAPSALINAQSTPAAALLPQSPDGMWWQQFDDPVLNALIADALASNLDLKLAVDRVRAARAARLGDR